MKKNKLSGEEIKNAIIAQFGSIDKYATFKNVKRANIYQRIKRQTPWFIKELKDDGVIINDGSPQETEFMTVARLKKYVELLEQRNKELEKELTELKKQKRRG